MTVPYSFSGATPIESAQVNANFNDLDSRIDTAVNNTGLVYIKSQTVGTAVTSVTVTNAFSADFDHYRILYKGETTSTIECLRLRMGGTTTGYYGNLIYSNFTTAAVLSAGENNTTTYWGYVSGGANGQTTMLIDVLNPFATTETQLVVHLYFDSTNAGTKRGLLADSNSYTDCTFLVASGNITGGTITVYGYRKA